MAKSTVLGTRETLRRMLKTMIEKEKARSSGMQRKPPFQPLALQVCHAFFVNAEKADLNPTFSLCKLIILFFY